MCQAAHQRGRGYPGQSQGAFAADVRGHCAWPPKRLTKTSMSFFATVPSLCCSTPTPAQSGRTALHAAASACKSGCIDLLLDAGIGINDVDEARSSGRFPLHATRDWL